MTALARRQFLALAAAGLAAGPAAAQQPAAGSGDAGQLYNPRAAGRPRERVTRAQNDAAIQAIEKQLKCTCGCNLDVYTCRTTDFTCTVSPERHREIVAWHEEGLPAAEVIDRYLAQHGEEFRMAPRPEGFNLAGYLVPGIAVLVAGLLLLLFLRGRRAAPALAGPELPAPDEASPEEMERLRRAMAEVEE